MESRLLNIGDLFSQSSNATTGLLGGGIFSQPETRGQRRSRLLTDAISNAGQNPYARLGAAFGGLVGMSARAGAEGLGILDAPPEVQRNEAIRQVQQEVAELGLDPISNRAEFGELVTSRFQELGQPELALRTQLQVRQMMPEGSETSRVIRGGTELGNAAGLAEGESAIGTFDAQGNLAGIKDRTQGQEPPGEFKTYYDKEGNAVQARFEGDTLKTATGEDITGQGYGTSSRTPLIEDNPELTSLQTEYLNSFVERGNAADGVEIPLYEAAEILSREDVDTGALEPLIIGVQGVAEDLGFDFNNILQEAGFEGVGDLSSKENLDTLLNRLLINSFEKFKGNLNDREVRIAQSANANVGRSKEANIRAVATNLAASEIARQRRDNAIDVMGPEGVSTFRESLRETGTDRFIELRNQYEEQILSGQFGSGRPTEAPRTDLDGEFRGFSIERVEQ
mgnify:CR=1 FL=1